MKFRAERDVLAEAVAWTARSIPTRPGTLPQLSGIKMATASDGLRLSGFDYETSAQVTLAADVADEGEVLVSGRLLADIARALPNQPVDVSLDGSKLSLACGSSRFSLQTMPVEDYPRCLICPRSRAASRVTPLPPRSPKRSPRRGAMTCCLSSPASSSRSMARRSRSSPPTGSD